MKAIGRLYVSPNNNKLVSSKEVSRRNITIGLQALSAGGGMCQGKSVLSNKCMCRY